MKQRVCRYRFGVAAFIASPGMITPDLTAGMAALNTLEAFRPFKMRKILLTVFIGFEPFSKLNKVLSFKNIHESIDFTGNKYMYLSTDF